MDLNKYARFPETEERQDCVLSALGCDIIPDLEDLYKVLIGKATSIFLTRGSGKTGMAIQYTKWAVELRWVINALRGQNGEKEATE